MGFCWFFRIKQLHHNHRGSLLFGFVNEPVLFSLTQSPWPDLFTWLVSIRQSDNYSNAPREDERHSICVRVSNTRDCLSPSHACPLSCEKNTKLYVMPWASLMFWHLTFLIFFLNFHKIYWYLGYFQFLLAVRFFLSKKRASCLRSDIIPHQPIRELVLF